MTINYRSGDFVVLINDQPGTFVPGIVKTIYDELGIIVVELVRSGEVFNQYAQQWRRATDDEVSRFKLWDRISSAFLKAMEARLVAERRLHGEWKWPV